MNEPKPKFKRGDVVQHRASGEKAIIISPLMRCVNLDHGHLTAHFGGFNDSCILEFAGSYRIDPGFAVEDFDYDEDLLVTVLE